MDSGKIAFVLFVSGVWPPRKAFLSSRSIERVLRWQYRLWEVYAEEMTMKDRELEIAGFEKAKASSAVYLSYTKARGLGLNLMEASIVVLLDAAWNPCVEVQCVMRA